MDRTQAKPTRVKLHCWHRKSSAWRPFHHMFPPTAGRLALNLPRLAHSVKASARRLFRRVYHPFHRPSLVNQPGSTRSTDPCSSTSRVPPVPQTLARQPAGHHPFHRPSLVNRPPISSNGATLVNYGTFYSARYSRPDISCIK